LVRDRTDFRRIDRRHENVSIAKQAAKPSAASRQQRSLAYHRCVRIIVLGLVAILLAACAAGVDVPSSATPTTATRTLPASTVEPPAVSPTLHIDRPPNDEMTITGTFGFDTIEGGCAYLQTDKTTRYEVLWPSGWTVEGEQLLDPDGTVAARTGDTLTLHGTIAVDRVSICQIGPIFEAGEVTTDR
jgi:hypothetical protein